MQTIEKKPGTRQTKRVEIILLALLLAVSILPFRTTAQELKYEELYRVLPSLQPQQAFNRLFAYQNQDPHFANTYIQLGSCSEKVFRSVDPIRNYDMSMYWVSNALLYYGLFPVYAKDNEARSNREYYANILIPSAEKKVQTEDILAYIKARTQVCKNYQDSLQLVFSALTKSKDSYNKCIEIYSDINNRYSSYNEALLKANPAFNALLDSLKANINRCRSNFDSYKKLTKTFPLQGYNQTYTLKPIETFRLDGITNSDFLLNRIVLWDFNKWTEDFSALYTNDIIALRTEIATIWKTFESTKSKIQNTPIFQDTLPIIDERFLFRLGKYDGNSLVRDMVDYLAARQDYLVLQKSPVNSAKDSATAELGKKFRYYYKLSQQQTLANFKLATFEVAINTEKVERFHDFFNDTFNGEAGVKLFAQKEGIQMKMDFDNGLENLIQYLENEKAFALNQGYCSGGKGVEIPLFVAADTLQDQTKPGYTTTFVSYEKGIPNYVCGKLKRANGKIVGFVAKVDQGKKISWVKEVTAKGIKEIGNDHASLVQGFSGGCVAMVTRITGDAQFNSLIRFNDKGQELLNKPMIQQTPAFLRFDEIAQEYIMIFGQTSISAESKFDSFTFCKADSMGTLKVNEVIPVSGNPINLVKSSGKYILFANYTGFTQAGITTTPQGGWGHLVLQLSLDGKVLKTYSVADNSNLLIGRVFPISTEEYSLIGREQQTNKIRYLILGKELNLIFQN